MNGLPYYPRYPRDFFDGTNGMTFELKGAYSIILDLIYMSGGKLHDEPRFIAGHMNCSVRAWNGYRAALIDMGKIAAESGIISNFRADKELIIQRSFQNKQRENASAPRKNNNLGEAMAKPTPSHTDTDTDTDTEKVEAIASKKKSPRCRLPDGWVPSDRNIQDAHSKQFTDQEIRDEADKFRDYHAAKATTFADWDAGWRTWLGNARKFAPRGVSGGNTAAREIAFAGRAVRTPSEDCFRS